MGYFAFWTVGDNISEYNDNKIIKRKSEGKVLSVRAVTRCNNCVEHILLFPFTWVLQDLFMFDPVYLWLKTWSNTQINVSFASVVKPLSEFERLCMLLYQEATRFKIFHPSIIMVFRGKILNCNYIICRLKDAQGHWWVSINIMQILQSYCYDSRFLICSSSILLFCLSFVKSIYLVILELRTACCKQDIVISTAWEWPPGEPVVSRIYFERTAYRCMWWARTNQNKFEIFQNPNNHG